MEGYLREAFENFLSDYLEIMQTHPRTADEMELAFSDELGEKVDQYLATVDWLKLWEETKPEEEG